MGMFVANFELVVFMLRYIRFWLGGEVLGYDIAWEVSSVIYTRLEQSEHDVCRASIECKECAITFPA